MPMRFDALVRGMSAVVRVAVCWPAVLLVSAAHHHRQNAAICERAVELRTALVELARFLHGTALPTLAQRLYRDEAYARSINEAFADSAQAHAPESLVSHAAIAGRVAMVQEARGASLVAIIQALSGLVAARF